MKKGNLKAEETKLLWDYEQREHLLLETSDIGTWWPLGTLLTSLNICNMLPLFLSDVQLEWF